MSILNIILLIMWCILIFIDGINAGIQFERGAIGLGITWAICTLLWTTVIVIRVLNL